MVTELLSPPKHIRESLAAFQSHAFSELIRRTTQSVIAEPVRQLDEDLRTLIAGCVDSLTVSQLSDLIDALQEFEWAAITDSG
jgi:hypothetical protein